MVVAYVFNPSTWEEKEGESLWVQNLFGLQNEFQKKLKSYTEKPCLHPRPGQRSIVAYVRSIQVNQTQAAGDNAPNYTGLIILWNWISQEENKHTFLIGR